MMKDRNPQPMETGKKTTTILNLFLSQQARNDRKQKNILVMAFIVYERRSSTRYLSA
jgi:hypothetical protein